MGFFSWKTSDTGESIPNRYCESRQTFPVKMLDPDGNSYEEYAYEGYGVFGGKSFYDLAAEINGITEKEAIEAQFNRDKWPDVKMPKLVRIECGKAWEDLPDSENCPGQGYWL